MIADDSALLGAAATQSDLTHDQVVSNAAILLFGGIETTEGMITNALIYLIEHPDTLARGSYRSPPPRRGRSTSRSGSSPPPPSSTATPPPTPL